MLRSMTGFASARGVMAPYSWAWELRSVNSKGQDIRLRAPDWVDGLELALRKLLSAAVARGNVTLSLRLSRDETIGAMQLNQDQLALILSALAEVESQAMEANISLAPSKASDVLAMRGVLDASTADDLGDALKERLLAEFPALISAFNDMRVAEGKALEAVLLKQLNEIESLIVEAVEHASARAEKTAETLRANLAKVLDNTDGLDEGRIAQELALIAVKSDVTEEVDRLSAHVGAARDLIAAGGTVGRKLDFLMQEFNREANTLCSKAQSTDLTRCGLALKAVIDQMREQVQNVE